MSDDKQRTATDILLSLESKIESLVSQQRTSDLTFKILANKIGALVDKLDEISKTSVQLPAQQAPQNKLKSNKFKIEAADTNKIVVEATTERPIDDKPFGNRRTARSNGPDEEIKPNINMMTPELKSGKIEFIDADIKSKQNTSPGSVPVAQRVVDKNGKAVYLAEIEILDASKNLVNKTRTNTAGKWTLSLAPGDYTVIVKRPASINREEIKLVEKIQVANLKELQELSNITVK